MKEPEEIQDVLEAANDYLARLNKSNSKLTEAEKQIHVSSKEAEKSVENTFNNLITTLSDLLITRREDLLKNIRETREESLMPLIQCRQLIEDKIRDTRELVKEGLNLQDNGVARFKQKTAFLGSLPEVPDLRDVPQFAFSYDPELKQELCNICSGFGAILKNAPVQIIKLEERPGAIMVEWQENDQVSSDIHEFWLQKFSGQWMDCYKGSETKFTVREVLANEKYLFRVCCKFEGESYWSSWSVPQIGSTSLKNFSWTTNQDYNLADANRIAVPIVDSPSLLISDGPQLTVGYCIEFTFLEFDGKYSLLGLMVGDESITDIKSAKYPFFCVDTNGDIIIDQKLKATKLPKVSKGSKMTFTTKSECNKVRVSVDLSDKIVTYDWHVPVMSKIYFAAHLTSNTKIMVE